jgi:hypothetical protein
MCGVLSRWINRQGDITSGLKLLNKGLNALRDSKSAFIQELGDVIRSKGVERKCKPAAKPVQVSRSELASPKPPQPEQPTQ